MHALIKVLDYSGKNLGEGVIALDDCRRETPDGKVSSSSSSSSSSMVS